MKGLLEGHIMVRLQSSYKLVNWYSKDVTYGSGPAIINRYLSEEEKNKFLRAGYRVRIVKYAFVLSSSTHKLLIIQSTWRSLVPDLEDRPLALCDSRTVNPGDFVAADRIIPDRVGEVYYLTHNVNHRWYVARSARSNTCWLLVQGTGFPNRTPTSRFCSLCTIHPRGRMHAVREAEIIPANSSQFLLLTSSKSVLTFLSRIP